MKRFNSIIAIFALAIVSTVVAFVSCKKEKQEQKSYNAEQSVQCSDNMDEYLISFKNKLLSAQKGEETISLEQAQRDLGNLLNFDFGDANYPTDVFHFDTINAKLTISNGNVELSHLAETYNTIQRQILDVFHNSNLPEKTVSFITCNFKEANNKDLDTEDVVIVLTTRGYTGEDEGTNSDWWRPTNLGGTCDGLLVGSWGGPEVEAQLLNNTLGSPTCLFGGRLYYTDHAYSNKYGDETYVYDPNFPFTHYYYKIYYSTTPNQNNECISDAALIVYRNNILDYWHNGEFDTELPSNHTLIGFYIDHMYRNYAYMWHVIAHHAHANCTDTPPIID